MFLGKLHAVMLTQKKQARIYDPNDNEKKRKTGARIFPSSVIPLLNGFSIR